MEFGFSPCGSSFFLCLHDRWKSRSCANLHSSSSLPALCFVCSPLSWPSFLGAVLPTAPLPLSPPPPQGLSHADGRPLFVFEAYEGLRTVESLDQSYLFVPAAVKEVYLARLLASLLPASETSACALPPAKHAPPADHVGVRSVIVFTSSCQ